MTAIDSTLRLRTPADVGCARRCRVGRRSPSVSILCPSTGLRHDRRRAGLGMAPSPAWVPTSRSVFRDAGTLPESLLTLPGCELLVGRAEIRKDADLV